MLLGSIVSASYGLSGSYALSASYGLSSSYASSASYALNVPTTASYAITASFANNVPSTASYSLTSSYFSASFLLPNGVSNYYAFYSASTFSTFSNLSNSGSFVSCSVQFLALLTGTSSCATSASYAVSSSYGLSSSYAVSSSNSVTSSYVATASYATSSYNGAFSYGIFSIGPQSILTQSKAYNALITRASLGVYGVSFINRTPTDSLYVVSIDSVTASNQTIAATSPSASFGNTFKKTTTNFSMSFQTGSVFGTLGDPCTASFIVFAN